MVLGVGVSSFLFEPCLLIAWSVVGLKESTSLWVEIPVGVRLPTAGSLQTPRKQDSHWELLLLLLFAYSMVGLD